jgi:predicted AlkP superfamily pyrophosphatase or phosphodiesterase
MNFLRSALLVVIVLAASPRLAPAADAGHVVVITIDGFPAYLLKDPKAPIPTLRKLAAEGCSAPDGMRVINPSVTWPDHTSIITGVRPDKHSVLFNGVLERPGDGKPVRVDPARDQADLVKSPTIYDLLHKAGLKTAAINWPCTRNAPGLDFNFPDVPEPLKFTSQQLKEGLVADSVLLDPSDLSFKSLSAPARDQVWTAAACKVIREHKPNFLLFHLLVVDGIHHTYGPQSMAGYTAVALADRHVRDVLEALDVAGIREQTTIFILADHGFAMADKVALPNVILRQAGWLTAGPTGGAVHAKAMAISEGGSALVYLDDRKTAADDRAKLVELFKGKEGIGRVYTPEEFDKLGLPMPDKNAQAPDLFLSAAPGYGFSGSASGEEVVAPVVMGRQMVGYHGYVADNPKMNAVFIASGRGIKRGEKVASPNNTDIAPTVAHLLGQEMKDTDGKVLKEILK